MNGVEPGTAPCTLWLGASLLRGRPVFVLMAGVPALIVLAFGLLVAWCASKGDGADIGEALRLAWQGFRAQAGVDPMLWLLAALVPVAVVLIYGHRLAWLRVSSTGLEARIPRWLGLGLAGQSTGRLDLRWHELQRVQLQVPASAAAANRVQQLNSCRLVLTTPRGEIRLNPFPWFDRSGADHRLGLRELFAARRLDVAACLRRAPLLRAIELHGPEIESSSPQPRAGAAAFDLMRHRGMVAQLGLLSVAAVYALADQFFLGSYRPLEAMPVWPFALLGGVAALTAWGLGRGAPLLERSTVAALVSAAAVAAVYPATLRYNAATAEPELVSYTAVGPGRFEASAGTRPPIDLSDHGVDEYWARYPVGATHPFTLLRGAAGFYQLDLQPLHERTRAFYEARAGE